MGRCSCLVSLSPFIPLKSGTYTAGVSVSRSKEEKKTGNSKELISFGMQVPNTKCLSVPWLTFSLTEAHVDVKMTENYTLKMFCIGFTKRRPNQVKRTCYAQSSQIRRIRRKMREIMVNQQMNQLQRRKLKLLVLKKLPIAKESNLLIAQCECSLTLTWRIAMALGKCQN